ncbi:alpha/beta hydrolase [Dellaglioa carnosa]|uniref:Alpha/beta hydrolase n=1 Tax=Dellaglioa carnosa TaxID=2995136 RepID=A0ABT4JMR3_9LACO|nr:alpha/beta hydrolase [Dellaglioa carnosa]MCZ2491664.1 alpha/beta hydrolase [Dellaglioa carnosa]MCZ2493118.1 alpha/beta hydrolase [Dellaglioa carnosa]MCZ2494741.1 alpha/beta hydrolase [Dellaglioa carnosa]MDK1731600.1 alpha/beta hydrolase [Dellaglioa carnosa]
MKKKIIIWIVSILVLFAVAIAGGSFYLYHYAIQNTEKTLTGASKKTPERTIKDKKWLAGVKKENWTQQSAGENLKLVADYVPAEKPSTKTVVVAHGYMENKENMASYIRLFHDAGYNVLAPDDRGQGKSEGDYIGFGWKDRLDYIKWTKKLIAEKGQDQRIGLFGLSMGAATVMMMSGEKLPTQVKAIVEDCGYTNVEDLLAYQLKLQFNLPKQPLITTSSWVTQLRAGYSFAEADSVKQLKKNKLPTLFIHGDKDDFVPSSMVYDNYKASAGKKELWIIKGAGHAKAFGTNPALYSKKVVKFMNDNLGS